MNMWVIILLRTNKNDLFEMIMISYPQTQPSFVYISSKNLVIIYLHYKQETAFNISNLAIKRYQEFVS